MIFTTLTLLKVPRLLEPEVTVALPYCSLTTIASLLVVPVTVRVPDDKTAVTAKYRRSSRASIMLRTMDCLRVVVGDFRCTPLIYDLPHTTSKCLKRFF